VRVIARKLLAPDGGKFDETSAGLVDIAIAKLMVCATAAFADGNSTLRASYGLTGTVICNLATGAASVMSHGIAAGR
jgi:hypothetical protein